jgi:hypothetical protein
LLLTRPPLTCVWLGHNTTYPLLLSSYKNPVMVAFLSLSLFLFLFSFLLLGQ